MSPVPSSPGRRRGGRGSGARGLLYRLAALARPGRTGRGVHGPRPGGGAPAAGRSGEAVSSVARSAGDGAGGESGFLARRGRGEDAQAQWVAVAGAREISRYLRVPRRDLTEVLSLDRVEAMLVGPMGYHVERSLEPSSRQEDGTDSSMIDEATSGTGAGAGLRAGAGEAAGRGGHPVLRGSWEGFPFLIEEPEDHPGTLLVTGDRTDPVEPGLREEVAASVNDWNREKFFPTVCLVDTPVGPVVRATYLMDLSTGVSDAQLRLHLDTALAACTQALTLVGPLLPEL